MTFELEANSMETFITQGLGWTDQDTRSITPPIYPSTTYERNSDLSYHKGRIYTRADNPTYDRLKALLTKLENGKEALLFSSGMSATVAIFQSLSPGDHIIASKNVYKGVKDWIFRFAHPWGIDFNLLPDNDPKTLTKNIKPGKTKIIWIETPTNPMMEITDITAFCQIAHRSKSLVVVDNTVSTPILTRPLEYGADLVLHSATKYLNGHGDVLAGALITKEDCELWKRIKLFTHDAGALPGPFEVWLVQRGIRTLHLRMKRSCDNAHKIAEYFKNHPKIDDIYYCSIFWKSH